MKDIKKRDEMIRMAAEQAVDSGWYINYDGETERKLDICRTLEYIENCAREYRRYSGETENPFLQTTDREADEIFDFYCACLKRLGAIEDYAWSGWNYIYIYFKQED